MFAPLLGAFQLDQNTVIMVAGVIILLVLSLTVHEFAHAWAAWKLGDDTATREGRLTLNPMNHIDPIGSLVFPAVGMLAHVPVFGWARPVPVNPVRFTRKMRMKHSLALVSAAGPIANVLLALLGVAVALVVFEFRVLPYDHQGWNFIRLWISMNVFLAFFNLIPIPPLDGSKILAGVIPDEHVDKLDKLGEYAPYLFLGLLISGAFSYVAYPASWLFNQLTIMLGLGPMIPIYI